MHRCNDGLRAANRRQNSPKAAPRRASPGTPGPAWCTLEHSMAARTIVTFHPDVACDVCGRRLLRGERPDVFLGGGQRRMVCELCTPRATHEGWRREVEEQLASPRAPRPQRGRSLLGRLRQLREPARTAERRPHAGRARGPVSSPNRASPRSRTSGPESTASGAASTRSGPTSPPSTSPRTGPPGVADAHDVEIAAVHSMTRSIAAEALWLAPRPHRGERRRAARAGGLQRRRGAAAPHRRGRARARRGQRAGGPGRRHERQGLDRRRVGALLVPLRDRPQRRGRRACGSPPRAWSSRNWPPRTASRTPPPTSAASLRCSPVEAVDAATADAPATR